MVVAAQKVGVAAVQKVGVAATEPTERRYSLTLPSGLASHVDLVATREDVSITDLFRRLITVGLIAVEAERQPEKAIILREGTHEQEIMIFPRHHLEKMING